MCNQTASLTENERARVIVGVLTIMFMAALDETIVSPAMPIIGASLGDRLWLSWVISVYLLTSTAVTPLFGKLVDLRGRRPVLYLCIAIFLAGSVICAMAPTIAVLIGGRAVQGIGEGGLMAAAQTIVAELAPANERARYYVYFWSLWAVSSVAGPLIGGVLAEHVHWSMIFWINLPIGAVCYGVLARSLSNFPDTRRNHKLDVVGAVLVIVATVLLLLALTWGGTIYPWGSLMIGGLVFTSLMLFGLFAWYQLQREEPLLPMRVLANPVIAYASVAGFFQMTCLVGISVYFPVYLQLIEEFGAAMSGLALVAFMSGASLGSRISGRFIRKSTHYKKGAVFGVCLAIGALVLLGLLCGKASFWVLEGTVAVTGLGFGTFFPIAVISVQNASEQRDVGIATATFVFLRSLGSVVGLAVLSAIVVTTDIASHIGSETATLDSGARAQIAGGFRWVFYAAASSQALSLLFLLRMEEKPLRGPALPVPLKEDSAQV